MKDIVPIADAPAIPPSHVSMAARRVRRLCRIVRRLGRSTASMTTAQEARQGWQESRNAYLAALHSLLSVPSRDASDIGTKLDIWRQAVREGTLAAQEAHSFVDAVAREAMAVGRRTAR